VPLKLIGTKNKTSVSIIWKNHKSSSTRYCRPIKFIFEKETISSTKHEVGKIQKEINEL